MQVLMYLRDGLAREKVDVLMEKRGMGMRSLARRKDSLGPVTSPPTGSSRIAEI